MRNDIVSKQVNALCKCLTVKAFCKCLTVLIIKTYLYQYTDTASFLSSTGMCARE